MNPTLRDRIIRHLDPLPDERAYQVLDYIEFLESKYAAPVASSANIFQRFTEGVEDTLRAGRVSTTAISETMGLLNKAVGVLSGVAAAGKSVATDIVDAASRAAESVTSSASGAEAKGDTRPVEPPAVPPKSGDGQASGSTR
jgi:hypothetical protein